MVLGSEGLAGTDVAGVALKLNVIVGELAKLTVIETDFLFLGANAKAEARDQVHEEQDQASHDKRVRKAGDRVSKLVAELDPVVVDPTTRNDAVAIEVGNVVAAEGSVLIREGEGKKL